MKKTILNFAFATMIALGAVACKDKEKNTDTAAENTEEVVAGVSGSFDVDTAASQITWKGSKPLGSHNGTINLSSGALEVKDGMITEGKFMMDMKSIVSLDLEGDSKANLENHLKGTVEGKEGDFFNVNEYPYATFILKGVSEVDGTMKAHGNLTIKDKTNPVEFPVSVSENGSTLTMKSEAFTIDRTKWGVNYGSKSVFDNLGDKFVNDEVELTISVVGNKS